MPRAGHGHQIKYHRRTDELLCCRPLFGDSVMASSLHSRGERGGRAVSGRGRTPQPTTTGYREPKTSGTSPSFAGPVLPLASFLGSLDRRLIMSTFDTLPGESNAHVISSIINLVCPQCGGRMSEFQCEGRCRRNWLAEWEWASQVTRSPKSRRGAGVLTK
jgi:hypothetical protein